MTGIGAWIAVALITVAVLFAPLAYLVLLMRSDRSHERLLELILAMKSGPRSERQPLRDLLLRILAARGAQAPIPEGTASPETEEPPDLTGSPGT